MYWPAYTFNEWVVPANAIRQGVEGQGHHRSRAYSVVRLRAIGVKARKVCWVPPGHKKPFAVDLDL
jgi:CRISPR/Cas system CSM-associated protein Csm3 (group 7 of RAMP superfamily)